MAAHFVYWIKAGINLAKIKRSKYQDHSRNLKNHIFLAFYMFRL